MKTKPKPIAEPKKPKPSATYEMLTVIQLLRAEKEKHYQDGWTVKEKGSKAVKEWWKRRAALNTAYDKLLRLTPQQWNKL